jgi:hypothetical protein
MDQALVIMSRDQITCLGNHTHLFSASPHTCTHYKHTTRFPTKLPFFLPFLHVMVGISPSSIYSFSRSFVNLLYRTLFCLHSERSFLLALCSVVSLSSFLLASSVFASSWTVSLLQHILVYRLDYKRTFTTDLSIIQLFLT